MKDFLWKLFTISKREEIQDIKQSVKELEGYCNEIERVSMDKEYCMAVWSERLEKKLQDYTAYHTGFDDGKDEGIEIGIEQGIQTGLAQGIKQGVQTGIEQEKVEIVLNMNKRKVPKDLISQYTNLSIEEVEEIISMNK